MKLWRRKCNGGAKSSAYDASELPSHYIKTYESPDGKTTIEDVDGIPWWKAELPHPKHKCWPQTRGWTNWLFMTYRCACGAIKLDSGPWTEKNSRQRK